MSAIEAGSRRRASDARARHAASRSGRHVAAGRAVSVVVVDDHEDIRAIFSEVLTLSGWSVRSFPDVPQALAGIREDPPDLVLTDINIGSLSGRALARAVRTDPRTEHVVVVAASGSVAPSQALLRQFDLFLVKPVELTTLSETLLAALERSAG